LAPGVPGAPVVVFAHGLEDSWTSWQPLAAELDPDWRLLALDLPWRPGNNYRWRTRSAGYWLGKGLDLIDAVPDLLVAHSYGANATLELLCALDQRPGRAAALVCPLYRLPHRAVTWRLFDCSRARFVGHMREGLRVRIAERASSMDPDVLESMVERAVDRVGPPAFLAVFDQFAASADLALGNVELPTLVLAGGADPTLSPEAAAALATGMPGGDLRVNDDYDHFCHIRQPSGVAAHLAELVDAATRATPSTVGELL